MMVANISVVCYTNKTSSTLLVLHLDRLAIQERYDDVNFDDDIEKDKKKYKLADQNKDQLLDKEEFGAFLYPGTEVE